VTRFTGFWDATGPGLPDGEIAVSIRYEETEVLLERLRERLEAVPPGTHVTIDLIAWADE
jgi:hypothetical protein